VGGSSSQTQTVTTPAQTVVTPVQRSVSVVVGYRYYMGMHMALTHGPVDFVSRITVGGKCAWSGISEGGRINIRAANLFGGEQGEGGVSGAVDFLQGLENQAINSYLAARLDGVSGTPAFRGVTSMVLRQVYVSANNPYLKPWQFTMTRFSQDWQSSYAEISPTAAEPDPYEEWRDYDGWLVDFTGSASNYPLTGSYWPCAPDFEQVCDGTFECGYNLDGPGVPPDVVIHGEGRYYGDGFPENWHLAEFASGIAALSGGYGRCNFGIRCTFDGILRTLCKDHSHSGQNWIAARNVAGDLSGAGVGRVCNAGDTAVMVRTGFNSHERYCVTNIGVLGEDPPVWPLPPPPDPAPSRVSTCEAGPCVDMNPAHIIRECLTNNEWGMGYAEADIDDDSFIAAADTLFDEQLGMSLLWDRETTIEAFIDEVVRHIDAALYVDRRTGKFVLKLIRDDYSASDLITLDPTNIERVENYRRPTFGELINTVTVLYMECPDDVQASVTVQDIALIQMQGGSIGATIEYMGFSNRRNAMYAAQRDLRALAIPILSCTIYTNAEAASLDIGDAFKFEWPDYHEDAIIMRVTGMAFGDGKTRRIRIHAVQDVFGTPEAPLLSEDASLWRNPNQPPGPVQNQIVEESPYWLANRTIPDLAAYIANEPDAGGFCVAADTPFTGLVEDSEGNSVYYGQATNATINQNDGVEWQQVGTMDFCPFATLDGAVSYLTTELPVRDDNSLDDVEVGSFAQIDDEIIRVDAVTVDSEGNTTVTVGRGCLDTVPTTHADGAGIYFWSDFYGSDFDQYLAGESYTFALRPRNGTGILPLADAPTMALTFSNRIVRPYPPGNVKINGVAYPTDYFLGPLEVTWSHRDRLQQTGETIIDTTEGTIGPEDGTTYTLRIEYDDGTPIYQETDITGESWTEDSDNPIPNGELVVKLWSERLAEGSSSELLESWQQHVIPIMYGPEPAESSSEIGSEIVSSESAALWTPAEITTALWLDAADADTITLNSGNVSQWDDKSGNGRHYSQASSTKQPAYTGGRVVFSAGQFLQRGSTDLLRNVAGASLFVVSRYESLGTNQMLWYASTNVTNASERMQLIYITSQNKTGAFARDNSGTQVGIYPAANDTVNQTVQWGHVVNFSGGDFSLYKNAAFESSSSGIASANTSNNASLGTAVGARLDETRFMDGDVCEIILTHTAVDTTTRQRIEGYLAHRWGLTSNLPGDHPYKDNAPLV
jgi:hypothetical protein